jgi:hypothetical protein
VIPSYVFYALGMSLVIVALADTFYVIKLFSKGHVEKLWPVSHEEHAGDDPLASLCCISCEQRYMISCGSCMSPCIMKKEDFGAPETVCERRMRPEAAHCACILWFIHHICQGLTMPTACAS